MTETKNALPLRFGVIGAGVISGAYLENYAKDPRTEVVGIADTNGDLLGKAAKTYGIEQATDDYRELLENKKIDIIVVATPHFLHHPMVMDALEAGKDVLCEKPLAMNAAQAEEMIGKAKAKGKRLFVGLNMRTGAGFRTVEKVIQSGKIGRPFLSRISYFGHELERMQDPQHWKGSKDGAGGGVLLDGGYHVIDIMNMFFGEPQDVMAVCCKCVIKTENKCEDNAVLLIKYSEEMIGEVAASFTIKNARSKQEPTLRLRLEVYGTEGSVWAEYYSHDDLGWQTTLVSGDKSSQIPLQPFVPENIQLHFVDCLLDGTTPIVTAEDALRVHRIVDAAYAQSGILNQ